MSITEFSQEMTAAAANFNDNLPCDIKSENTQQTTAMLTTQNALTWEMVPNIIKIKHEHELPTAYKLHNEMVRKSRANDLLCYIEPENILRMKLLKQIATQEVAPNVMTGHEHELSDALKLHDEMIRKSRAKRGMEIKRMWNDSKNLKNVLEEKRKELETARRDAIMYEIRSIELQLQLNKLQAERKNVAEKDRDSKEIDRLKTLLDDAQKLHEERTLMLQELYDQNEARIRANREIRLQIEIMAKQLRNEQDESLESDKARNTP
ncbi:uncharacterized protein LOC115233150 isoform X5 [Formica exsecta]|uniref:uncharacterized protein LOC115233150 isoform X5 n=1 Tax=Formica exsecta TaxID=72781 RepID=UPI001142B1A0|nr:uncharacterized protein LOC115233150 isoform X5 [Formica exsecta]